MPTIPAVPYFNSTTPAAPAGFKNIKFQTDNGQPIQNVSAYVNQPIYDVTFAYPGAPPGAYVFYIICYTYAVNYAANFAGSQAYCGTNPTATATYTFKKIHSGTTSTTGTLAISTAGAMTFASTGGAAQSYAIGDVLLIVAPAADATLADVTMTLAGTR